jgi:hypothetical protein
VRTLDDRTYEEARRRKLLEQLRELERLDAIPTGGDDEGYLARLFDARRTAFRRRQIAWIRKQLGDEEPGR